MYLDFILSFFIYGFLGWITEVIYCFVLDGEVVNRGFLKGPICPIYAVGASIVMFFLRGLEGQFIKTFFLGLIIASILEYITSYFLECLFHTKWWDYSNNKFNLNGRVCLLNSTMFGFLSVFFLNFINPLIKKLFLLKINEEFKFLLVIVLIMFFLIDLYKSVKTLTSINKKVYKIKELEEKIIKEKDINKEFDEFSKILKERLNLTGREKGVLKAFPKGKHRKYNEILKKIKKYK